MSWTPPPPFPDDGYARIAEATARVLGTGNDVVLVQAEAIVALEAAASGLAGPGVRALNLVTSPYGDVFGAWLARGGAEVVTVRADAPGPLRAGAVADALVSGSFDVVAVVHGEAASGILNPIDEIAALVRDHGALLVVDAVATAGGHRVAMEAWGADLVVTGAQKALDGPSSLSAVAVSPRGWDALERREADRGGRGPASILSLLDQKRDWLDLGRGALPGIPDAGSFHALAAALERVEAEGLDLRIARHAAASAHARTRAAEAGLAVFPPDERDASHLVTAVEVPDGVDRDALLRRARAIDPTLSAGVGTGTERLIRVNHTGHRAAAAAVDASIAALAATLET